MLCAGVVANIECLYLFHSLDVSDISLTSFIYFAIIHCKDDIILHMGREHEEEGGEGRG